MFSFTQSDTLIAALVTLGGAALLHANFQVAVSVLTLLSGHALGIQHAHGRLLRMMYSYVGGAFAATVTLLINFTYLFTAFNVPQAWWLLSGLSILLGLIILWLLTQPALTVWLPVPFADYLYDRTTRTTRSFEAFGLGMATVIAELPFLATPLLIGGYLLRGLPSGEALSTITLYGVLSIAPLLLVAALVGRGRRISSIRRWRDHNRRFLQAVNGVGFIVLGIYVLVTFGTEAM